MGGHSSGGLFPGALEASGRNSGMSLGDGTISKSTSASSSSVGGARESLLSKAVTNETKRIIKELYRMNAKTGDGGTADAIRAQLKTGKMVGGKDHIRKGRERLRQIEKILARDPFHPDKDMLKQMRDDLRDALGGA